MFTKNVARLVVVAGGLCAAGGAFAQDAGGTPNVALKKTIGAVTPTGPVPSLSSSIRREPSWTAAS